VTGGSSGAEPRWATACSTDDGATLSSSSACAAASTSFAPAVDAASVPRQQHQDPDSRRALPETDQRVHECPALRAVGERDGQPRTGQRTPPQDVVGLLEFERQRSLECHGDAGGEQVAHPEDAERVLHDDRSLSLLWHAWRS
jgi:hypothetical protein